MIVQQYADEMGVDGDTVQSYIADMTDEDLFSRVREAMEEQVRAQYAASVQAQLGSLTIAQLAQGLDLILEGSPYAEPFTDEQYVYLYDNYMPATRSESTYEDNLDLLGYVDLDSPATISIYATTFAEKDKIADLIADYNSGVEEESQITYTDYVALLMSSITDIISGISYLLIAFVSISLVVSSIMIGIITNISVLERTKEIGILRAVGASKRDISRVFNAETLIVGLAAGLLGIAVSVLLTIPINAVIHHFTGLDDLSAALPVGAAAILVLISICLTVIAGLVPSRSAARKDPVEALRSE
jgi:putative ABC transport system permease protein